MKKTVLSILAIIIVFVLIVPVSFAEEFTLHSGVKFGMTKEEVVNTEKASGFTDIKYEKMYEESTHNCSNIHQNEAVIVDGQIAGKKGASIYYHFDNDGILASAVYILGFGKSSGDYNPIRESLVKKYGSSETSLSEVWDHYLDMCVYSYPDYYKDIGMLVDYNYNDSWLIEQDDGSYVIITGCEFYFADTSSSYDRYYVTLVGYQHFSKEAVENALNDIAEKVNTYNNQLENDL